MPTRKRPLGFNPSRTRTFIMFEAPAAARNPSIWPGVQTRIHFWASVGQEAIEVHEITLGERARLDVYEALKDAVGTSGARGGRATTPKAKK